MFRHSALKVLFIITRSDVMGGASVHLLDLAAGLQERNYNVHILVGGIGILQQRAAEFNLSISSVPSLMRQIHPLKDLKAYFELKRAIREFKPDLVHLHSSKAGLLGRLACKATDVPCVFTAHGWAFTEGVSAKRRWLYRVLERLAAPLAAKIIAVSDYDKALALQNGVATASSLTLVHNGVADKAEHTGVVQHCEKAEVRLIMVARFEQPKDQPRLLRVLSQLTALPWHLELVGDGPGLPAAQALCRQLGIAAKVTFSGACTDVPRRLAAADTFVLLSHWEGLPLTILEAMSLGLPVVASDVGGVSETIDKQCGFLIAPTDDSALLNAFEQLISSASLRATMGMAARTRYQEHFTLERMINDTERVYQQVAAKL
ncbi:glycosyltransferase family 4 protein [Rheinheimera sp. NSM]|uniref:glycosyltransferase family 4 protein n=1 Tax=Rheinheimera sp. NSM TaxID=3457884 RepID=UPI00403626BA